MIDVERAATLAAAEERLRQERETFDQRKQQNARWFTLRLTMGFIAALLLPVVAVIMLVMMLGHEQFPSSVVGWAGRILFADVVGLLITVWKFALNPGSVTRLEPVTSAELTVKKKQKE